MHWWESHTSLPIKCPMLWLFLLSSQHLKTSRFIWNIFYSPWDSKLNFLPCILSGRQNLLNTLDVTFFHPEASSIISLGLTTKFVFNFIHLFLCLSDKRKVIPLTLTLLLNTQNPTCFSFLQDINPSPLTNFSFPTASLHSANKPFCLHLSEKYFHLVWD